MMDTILEATAEYYGLKLEKRITTGSAVRHFATFELSGPHDAIKEAWETLQKHRRGPAFDYIGHVTNRNHPDFGHPYICFESVWCDLVPEAESRRT